MIELIQIIKELGLRNKSGKINPHQELNLSIINLVLSNAANLSIILILIIKVIKKLNRHHNGTNKQPK
jgi:hypothetical protein